jgi:hypothetical protein
MTCSSLLLTTLALALHAQDTLRNDASIYGEITSTDTTFLASISPAPAPIGGVMIDVTVAGGETRQQTGDDTGAYSLVGLAAGVYTLHFARTGYIPLTLDVRVPEHGAVHLDVTLDRALPAMQTIKVVAKSPLPRITGSPPSTGAYRPWKMEGDRMHTLSSLDFPDVVRAIGTSPGGAAGPESGSGIHLQGGSTNHTQLLFDGVPLYNAVHAGDHPSAIDPDAVA